MDSVTVYERAGMEDEPENCTYCTSRLRIKDTFVEYFPHEAGGYCIFMPRSETDYACEICAFGTCECCNVKQPRFGFIKCEKCNKTHCFNNTDMVYENNPFLRTMILCNARFCANDSKTDEMDETNETNKTNNG